MLPSLPICTYSISHKHVATIYLYSQHLYLPSHKYVANVSIYSEPAIQSQTAYSINHKHVASIYLYSQHLYLISHKYVANFYLYLEPAIQLPTVTLDLRYSHLIQWTRKYIFKMHTLFYFIVFCVQSIRSGYKSKTDAKVWAAEALEMEHNIFDSIQTVSKQYSKKFRNSLTIDTPSKHDQNHSIPPHFNSFILNLALLNQLYLLSFIYLVLGLFIVSSIHRHCRYSIGISNDTQQEYNWLCISTSSWVLLTKHMPCI